MFGDGDPTEWGCAFGEGWEVYHPPWGPVEVRPARRPHVFVPLRRTRWRRWAAVVDVVLLDIAEGIAAATRKRWW